MKFILLLALLLATGAARASQIVTGVHSERLAVWSVWEQQGSRLTHYLLLYNGTAADLPVRVGRRRFTDAGTTFREAPAGRTFFRGRLRGQQLLKLRYPGRADRLEFFEFFEAGQSVGLLGLDTSRPPAALLAPELRFYSNQGLNAGAQPCWVALPSIQQLPPTLPVLAESRFRHKYYLLRTYARPEDVGRQHGRLDSLAAAGPDATIIRLDSAHRQATLPVLAPAPTTGLRRLTVLIEQVETSFFYDEQKRPVPDKGISGGLWQVPIFPPGRP